MIQPREGALKEYLEDLKTAYENLLLWNLPSHLTIHSETDEKVMELVMKELRLLAADFMLTADMIERTLITWRGDND